MIETRGADEGATLPEWYPLADATDDEIDEWLEASAPPFDAMRKALPWLTEDYQFEAWLRGLREARDRYSGGEIQRWVTTNFPLPPRRVLGRMSQ